MVHVFVPLCDNEHQGIIPVNASLGNGMNLQTNLYWGARYGVKSHFKSLPAWKLLVSKKDPAPFRAADFHELRRRNYPPAKCNN